MRPSVNHAYRAAIAAVALISTSCGNGSGGDPAAESGDRSDPAFTFVEFGDADGVGGTVAITNLGSSPVPMEDYQICRSEECVGLPPERLQPGKSLLISSDTDRGEEGPDEVMSLDPRMAGFAPDGGEFSLHDRVDTGDPEGLVSYVAWGSGGRTYGPVAVAAGMWVTEGSVNAEGAQRISAPQGATDPEGWTAS